MDGLIMIKDYLDEILDGKKVFDARSYPTNKRGTIALVDSKKSSIIGLVDLILMKSISRFARNTLDLLFTVRKLTANGVEVFFEEQGISTLDGGGELFLTIMSSIAHLKTLVLIQ